MSDNYEYKPPLGFDISVSSSKGKKKKKHDNSHRACEWSGCDKPGPHRAPKTPGQLENYRWFCQSHAQQYNKSWNFFEDMSEEEMSEYQAATLTGDRPTWGMGTNAWAKTGKGPATGFEPGKTRPRDRTGGLGRDPFETIGEEERRQRSKDRHIPKLQKQALETLHLEESCSMEDVKQRYKDMVKRFHPDANGGDRGAEDRLREVINAYRTLRAANFH